MKLSDRLAAASVATPALDVDEELDAELGSNAKAAAAQGAPAAAKSATSEEAGAATEAKSAAGDDGRNAAIAVLDWVTIGESPDGSEGPVAATRPVQTASAEARPELQAVPELLKAEARTHERVRHIDPLAGIKRSVHQSLLDALGPTLYDAELDERELAVRVRQTLSQVIETEQTLITAADRLRITNEVSDEILGHGPLEPFLRDSSVTEIMVNGADQIYVERDGRIHYVNASFTDDNHLRHTIDKIVGRVGRRIDESSPMVDARLPDGSRVNAVLPPVALDGPMLTIRKFAADPLGMQDLVDFGTLTPATATLLAACVRARLNVVISGGTGSGKTTTLNVLSSFVPGDERIVTIEDAAELQLRQDGIPSAEHRGTGRGHSARPGPQRAAYAS
jgi:hypothetical protein